MVVFDGDSGHRLLDDTKILNLEKLTLDSVPPEVCQSPSGRSMKLPACKGLGCRLRYFGQICWKKLEQVCASSRCNHEGWDRYMMLTTWSAIGGSCRWEKTWRWS